MNNMRHALRKVVNMLLIACHTGDQQAYKKMLAAHLAAHLLSLLSHTFAWNCPLVKAAEPIYKDWC